MKKQLCFLLCAISLMGFAQTYDHSTYFISEIVPSPPNNSGLFNDLDADQMFFVVMRKPVLISKFISLCKDQRRLFYLLKIKQDFVKQGQTDHCKKLFLEQGLLIFDYKGLEIAIKAIISTFLSGRKAQNGMHKKLMNPSIEFCLTGLIQLNDIYKFYHLREAHNLL